MAIENPFWVSSDGKTVHRLTEKEYLKLLYKKRLIGYIDESIIVLVKGSSSIILPMKQLKQILQMGEK